jgi:hypothetical protein
MDWLEIAIEEYKTLREESLTSMKMQQSILTFGTATMDKNDENDGQERWGHIPYFLTLVLPLD